jgi:hypothetical protein
MSAPYREYIGVYDADATLWGELSYWVGARLGVRHCALCEVTHGLVRRKAEWDRCAAGLAVPFTLYHRDDAPADVRAAVAACEHQLRDDLTTNFVLDGESTVVAI